MTKLQFTPEDFFGEFRDASQVAQNMFDAWYKENAPVLMRCGKYHFSIGLENSEKEFLWMSKEDGEGMGLSEETLDKIWKKYF